ncbi:FecR family protein [Chitinophaga qingshengii]|uniref:FecR domain-containing protein n=1 Tax=Chitinophaga qingshengii TaxID=1569794 RepID=A0ABR7TJ36_9BACT|nr:FecR domain-containing protein [Chitinophaga qingshengii]MBC9930516.1 FecR domain-containing protein [Chitinophaga qingshengii]
MTKHDATDLQALIRKIQEHTATAEELRRFLHMTEQPAMDELLPYGEWQQTDGEALPPGLKEKVIQAAPQRRMRLLKSYLRKTLPYAAAVMLLLALHQLLPRIGQRTPALLTVTSKDGEIKRITLPDSTTVILNARSTIRYAATPDTLREVFLEGEAYFDVRANEHKPFVVRSGALSTRVLGTSFNVRAYPGETQQLGVVSGKIQVSSPEGKSVLLGKGDQVTYDAAASFVSIATDPQQMSNWQNGIIDMNNLTLQQVAAILERWYSVKVILLSPGIGQHVLSGTQTNSSLTATLESICFVYNLQYEQDGQIIKIREK